MKKAAVYLSILIVLSVFINPEVIAQRFTGGLVAGLSACQVDGDTYSGYNKAGVTFGGWVNLSISDRSAVQVGLNYIQKGSRHNPDFEKGDETFLLIKLGYVEMPIIYQYKMKNRFYLEAGGSLGLLLHSYFDIAPGIPQDNPFRLIDAGIQAGIGYRFSEKMRVGLRSGSSVLSIRKNRVPGDRRRYFGYGQYNNVLALELSYIL